LHLIKFRTGNFIYVYKTVHVYNLLQNEMAQCFLSRPRIFGKSLLLSMMKALFLGDKELFRGLYIYDFKPYPVIHMTFTQLEYDKTVNDHMALYYALQKYLGKILPVKTKSLFQTGLFLDP